MKVFVIAVAVFAAFLQADARSIGISRELPKVLQETMEQSFSCAMQLGPKASNMPRVHGLEQLPEDNGGLNELWGCIFVKKGIVDTDGDVNEERLHKYLMDMFTMFVPANDEIRSMADEITDTCLARETSNYQLKSVKIQNCINRLVKEKTGV